MAEENHVYTTSVRWESERRGSLTSPGLPDLAVATPPQFPGGHAGIWSPEHLFVAAAEACLMTTFLAIAENSKLEYLEYSSEAEGVLEKTDEGFMITARRIVEKAEQHCLISKSMKTRVSLEPDVVVRA